MPVASTLQRDSLLRRLRKRCAGGATAALLGYCALLAGCSTKPVELRSSMPSIKLPVLALPADSLGCAVSVQQRLTVQHPGQTTQTLEALLEVDTQDLHLALFHMGQRMGTLAWNGSALHADVSRWWPEALKPEQIISDMQLALWPIGVVQSALPTGWEIVENESGRSLLYQHETHISIEKRGDHAFEIAYVKAGWRLRVDSPQGLQLCTANAQGT